MGQLQISIFAKSASGWHRLVLAIAVPMGGRSLDDPTQYSTSLPICHGLFCRGSFQPAHRVRYAA